MKKYILLGIIAILGIAMIIFVFKTNEQTGVETMHSVSNNTELNQSSLPHSDGSDLSVKKSDQSVQPIFHPISKSDIRNYNIPDIFNNTEDGFLFTLDHQTIDALKEGDQFQMQMLKLGINRKGTINSIENRDGGIKNWRGTFDGYDPNHNYFSITQSQKDAYANIMIITDNGQVVAEVINGIGFASLPPATNESDSIYPSK